VQRARRAVGAQDDHLELGVLAVALRRARDLQEALAVGRVDAL
jgi:hypothetical protein